MAQAKPSAYVLDSYALLALFASESGWRNVKKLLGHALAGRCKLLMSVVNLGEVLYIVERNLGLREVHRTLARIEELPIEISDADRTVTVAAAHIKAHYKIAYADCFAAALAKQEKADLVTGDPEFKPLEKDAVLSMVWL